jgi:hypothetical protein
MNQQVDRNSIRQNNLNLEEKPDNNRRSFDLNTPSDIYLNDGYRKPDETATLDDVAVGLAHESKHW